MWCDSWLYIQMCDWEENWGERKPIKFHFFCLHKYQVFWRRSERGIAKWAPPGSSSVSPLVMVLLARLVSWFPTPAIPFPRFVFFFFSCCQCDSSFIIHEYIMSQVAKFLTLLGMWIGFTNYLSCLEDTNPILFLIFLPSMCVLFLYVPSFPSAIQLWWFNWLLFHINAVSDIMVFALCYFILLQLDYGVIT